MRMVPDLDGSSVFLFAAHRPRATDSPSDTRDNFVANMGTRAANPR